MKVADLKKTAKELNDILFDDKTKINVNQSQSSLENLVKEAATLLDEGEEEELTAIARRVIAELKENKEEVDEEEVDEEEVDEEEVDEEEVDEEEVIATKKVTKVPVPSPVTKINKTEPLPEDKEADMSFDDLTLQEQVQATADLLELKKLVKSEETFKYLRHCIGIQKDAKKLKTSMLLAIKAEQATPVKAASKPAPVKKEVVKNTGDKPESCESVASRLVASKATEAVWLSTFTAIYKAKGKTDTAFIQKRIDIYKEIALRKAGLSVVKPAKK